LDERRECSSYNVTLFMPGWLGRYSDLIWAGRSGDRIPVGTRFSAAIQTDRGTDPESYTVGNVLLRG
jgi:hypothetical protein